MYAKFTIAVLLIMAFALLSEGLPGITIDVMNLLPSKNHCSQYNLIFYLMLLITIIALIKPRRGGTP